MGLLDLNISRMKAYNKVNGRYKRMNTLISRKAAHDSSSKSEEKIHGYMNRELKKAAEVGDVECFITILDQVSSKQGLEPNDVLQQSDYKGNTCLHIAAKHGRLELIGLLMTHPQPKTLFTKTNNDGDTVLHTAAKAGHLSVTNLIARFDGMRDLKMMNRPNGNGNMPIHEALIHDHQHLVDLLFHLDERSSFFVNKQGKSAFYLAVETGNVKTFNAMLDAECWQVTDFCDILEEELMKGRSLLHAAVSRKDKAMLQQILGKGLQMLLHVKDETGQNPIEFASSIGFDDGENILRNGLTKGFPNTNDVCVDQQVVEVNPDDLCSLLDDKEEEEDDEEEEGGKQSPNSVWECRHERMRKLLQNVMLPQTQPMSHNCMDHGLYVTTKKGDVDEFISALEKYSEEKNLPLPIIFGQLTPLKNTFLHVASTCGRKDLSWLIIQYFPSLLLRANSHGNTALHLAAKYGRLDIVKILVAFRSKKLGNMNDETSIEEDMQLAVENDDGRTPLQLAVKHNFGNDVMNFLIKENVEKPYQVNRKGISSLYVAISDGKIEKLKNMFNTLSHCVDQNILDDQLTKGKSLLLAAVRSEEMEILRELARQTPVLFNIKDEHAQKLVHFAELLGFHEGANYLRNEFKLEIVLDCTLSGAIPPPHSYSLDAYSLSVIEQVDPEIENIRQMMHHKGRHERMRKLYGIRSADNMPENFQHHESMDIELYEAAKKGDIDGFIDALEKVMEETNSSVHFILKQRTHIMNTFLHVAASHGNEEFTSFIVFYFRSLLGRRNNKGNTENHEAARAGHLGVLDILVKFNKYHRQLDFYRKYDSIELWSKHSRFPCNNSLNTSILEAFINNQRKVIEYLIKSRIEEAYPVNQEGKSGLYLAVEAGMVDIVETMLNDITSDAKANYICELMNGNSLINAAIRRRSIVMLQEIARKIPAQIHVIEEDGQTPLTYAVSSGFLEGLNCLLDEFKMDTSKMDSNGFYPIHIASKCGHVHILQKLMQSYPDAGAFRTHKGQNILHVAATYGRDNVVRFILETPYLEFLINETDDDGNTSLHLATINWHPMVVSSLTWDDRVNLTLVNKDGLTALDAAEEYMETQTSFQQRLTWRALMSVGTPRSGYKYRVSSKKQNSSEGKDEGYNMDHSKERVNTLLLVATLVATVTFAAGFTMPGGYNNSEPKEGQATLLRKVMLQVFVICDTIAVYSSIMVAVTLIWAQLGDLALVVNALRLAIPLLAISLTTMSAAFMVGVALVVGSLTWLVAFVLIFGILCVASVLILVIPLCFFGLSTSPVLRYVSYYVYHLLHLASESSHNGIQH